MKATLSVGARGVRSPAVATESLVMRRVYRDQRMGHRAPARCCVSLQYHAAMKVGGMCCHHFAL